MDYLKILRELAVNTLEDHMTKICSKKIIIEINEYKFAKKNIIEVEELLVFGLYVLKKLKKKKLFKNCRKNLL